MNRKAGGAVRGGVGGWSSAVYRFSSVSQRKQNRKEKKTERENDIMIKIIFKKINKSSSLKLPVFSLSLF